MDGRTGDSSAPTWPTLRLSVPEHDVELAAGDLWHLGATGIEERTHDHRDGCVELIGGFPTAELAAAAAGQLRPSWSARLAVVDGTEWLDAWREHFEPVRVGRIVIAPAWKECAVDVSAGDVRLDLDPGHAFGTGGHASTRLALELLQRVPKQQLQGARVLDAGCGSGVLSIASALLGAAEVNAVDIEREAVRVTEHESRRNGVADRIVASLVPVKELTGTYDVIVANILAPVLIELAPSLCRLLRRGGCIILAGLIDSQVARVLGAYRALSTAERVEHPPWVGLTLRS